MKITVKKLAKCVFRSGRQALVDEVLREQLTADAVATLATHGAVDFIRTGSKRLTESQKSTMHTRFMSAHDVTGKLLEITSPDSDGGHDITPGEEAQLVQSVSAATGGIVTDDVLAKVRAAIVAKVP